jgi:hypothetical protein
VPGHALRDLDAAAIRQVVRDPRGAEGVAADGRFDAGCRSLRGHEYLYTFPGSVCGFFRKQRSPCHKEPEWRVRRGSEQNEYKNRHIPERSRHLLSP